MTPTNLLVIMSDEHNRRVLGSSGHAVVRTPNLDRLAARGVRFTDAYCNSPICVPSRASFATGRYVHQIRFWDNAIPYDGSVTSWGHRLRERGNAVTSIGKLHFRSTSDPNGFDEEILPLHVVGGVGDLLGLIRDDAPASRAAFRLAEQAGRGDSAYQSYDDSITEAAVRWLARHGKADKPWVLFVSLVCPHFPLISRPEWYDLYSEAAVPWPEQYAQEERPRHPYIDAFRNVSTYDRFFDEAKVRKAITAYLGMVSFVDANVGRILAALEGSGLGERTRILYTSDHGDNLGARGLWGKSNLYEDAVGVPMILAGPQVTEGIVCREPVSLVDGFPTILDCVGAQVDPRDADLPGASLFDVLAGRTPRRVVFGEYHAWASVTGAFMIRKGDFKYMHYVGMPPQLFDVASDPWEARDLAPDPGYAGLVRDMEAVLRRIVDPEAVDALARADQRARMDAFGGREAILERGSFCYTPAPGTAPVFD